MSLNTLKMGAQHYNCLLKYIFFTLAFFFFLLTTFLYTFEALSVQMTAWIFILSVLVNSVYSFSIRYITMYKIFTIPLLMALISFLVVFLFALIGQPDLSAQGQEKSQELSFLVLVLPFLSSIFGAIRLFLYQ